MDFRGYIFVKNLSTLGPLHTQVSGGESAGDGVLRDIRVLDAVSICSPIHDTMGCADVQKDPCHLQFRPVSCISLSLSIYIYIYMKVKLSLML